MRRTASAIAADKQGDLTIVIAGYDRRLVADALYAECARMEAEARDDKRKRGMRQFIEGRADRLRSIANQVIDA